MDSYQLARYIEETGGISKPWLLVLLRLQKLQERRSEMTTDEFLETLSDIHQDAMQLGDWWVGIEAEVLGQ